MENTSVDKLRSSAGVAGPIAVNATADIRTHSQNIAYGSNWVLMYRATGTSPDMDLYLEQGPGDPTTEGSAGDSSDGWHRVGAKLADVLDNNWGSVVLAPEALPFLRIHVDGQGANPANSTIELKLSKQETLE